MQTHNLETISVVFVLTLRQVFQMEPKEFYWGLKLVLLNQNFANLSGSSQMRI